MPPDWSDTSALIESRLKVAYSLPPHGTRIRLLNTPSSGYTRAPNWWAVALFTKWAAAYQQSSQLPLGPGRYAARVRRENALSWLTAWLNTFCDGTPM